MRKSEPHNEPVPYIGIDTEYVSGTEKNDVVSYQAHVLATAGEYDWIQIMEPGKRLRLADMVRAVLQDGMDRKYFKRWPWTVNVAIHWSLADLTSFDDFVEFRKGFDGLSRTYVSLKENYLVEFFDKHRNKRLVSLRLFDTMLLAPEGQKKLANIGELLGLAKLDVAQADLANMRKFQQEEPDKFRAYAVRDAEIAARYLREMEKFYRELTCAVEAPITIGQIAIDLVIQEWMEAGRDRLAILGLEKKKIKGYEIEVPVTTRHAYDSIAVEAYMGGRAETYHFGATTRGVYTDWDLAGAYATSLCALGQPCWDSIRKPRNLQELDATTYSAAYVEFSFPEEVKFPCLPVRSDSCLIFPLQGESYATGAEISLARNMGARMRILNDIGYIMEMGDDRPFEEFAKLVTRKRAEFQKSDGKGGLRDLLIKTIGNSVYGKVAQSLGTRKRVFDTRSEEMKDMLPSKLTNPFLAAQTTGLVRAVIGEILHALHQEGQEIVSCTTDGFLTSAPEESVHRASQGPLSQAFLAARRRLVGEEAQLLEKKHGAAQLLAWRTRGQATLAELPGQSLVLAKAGIPAPMSNRAGQNAFILDHFVNRRHDTRLETRPFRGLRDIHQGAGRFDLTRKTVFVAQKMDYDFKGVPSVDYRGTRDVNGVPHLWFTTSPLPSERAFKFLREEWRGFTKMTKAVMKSEADMRAFESYISVVGGNGIGRHRGEGSEVDVLVRMFLRAYVRGELGLHRELNNRQLARTLCDIGYEVSVRDVENARREKAMVIEGSLRPTPMVLRTIENLKRQFPAFDPAPLLEAANPLAYDQQFHSRLGPCDTPQVTSEG